MGQAIKVLVVEDERGLRYLVSDVLRNDAHFDVIEAATGDEALQILSEAEDFDCMFTDIRMPGKYDGIELAKYALIHYPNLKIIMTSGNLGPKELPDHLPFVPKPYDFFEVADAIRAAVKS